MAWDVKAVESRNVAFGQGALRYGLFGYGGQGLVRPVVISSVTVWRVKAVKARRLSAGRGEFRLVTAVTEW